MNTTPRKATPEDAGLYVAGQWGQYGVAHMIADVAQGFGFDDADLIALANRHLASMAPSGDEGLSDDEHESLIWASEEVESWLNAYVAPQGFSFGWNDGEFFLWSDEDWQDAP